MNTQRDGRYKGYNECIMKFAEMHNIIIDPDHGEEDDISFEGMKKGEQRFRKGKGDGISLVGLLQKEYRKRKASEKHKTQQIFPKSVGSNFQPSFS